MAAGLRIPRREGDFERSRPTIIATIAGRVSAAATEPTSSSFITLMRSAEDLGLAMRDEDDRGAGRPEVAEDGEEALDVRRRQRRGRLVEDEDAPGGGEGAGDLDELALGDRQLADRLCTSTPR